MQAGREHFQRGVPEFAGMELRKVHPGCERFFTRAIEVDDEASEWRCKQPHRTERECAFLMM